MFWWVQKVRLVAHFLWALKDAKVVLAKAPGEFVYWGVEGWGVYICAFVLILCICLSTVHHFANWWF